jgi:uncharacterized protein YkwD
MMLRLAAVLAAACGAAPVATAAPPAASTTNEILDAHNRARRLHCAPPLAWSARLAAVAQRWADKLRARGCAFEHSRTEYGENLAAGTSGTLSPSDVVAMWVGEARAYNYARGGFSMSTGHFTQVVWRGSTELGCGRSQCNGMDVWVCNYSPAGNVEGEFRENVRPEGCASARKY